MLGIRLPVPVPSVLRVEPGDTLVLATDGIRQDFSSALSAVEPPGKLAERVLAEYAKGHDDALVVVARFR